jgi:hypothetical protein
VIVPGGTDLAGGAAVSWGDPDQVACFVGEGEEQQSVFLVLAVVVPPVRGAERRRVLWASFLGAASYGFYRALVFDRLASQVCCLLDPATAQAAAARSARVRGILHASSREPASPANGALGQSGQQAGNADAVESGGGGERR